MFNKILVANRGEIALRVIRACKELGIKTVAVYSDIDKDSLHVKMADEAYCIGPAQSSLSYLYIPHLLSVAEIAKVDAVHPGYGFLSENSKFAEICEEHNMVFVGPSPGCIEKMGDKVLAREILADTSVPVVPGSKGKINCPEEAKKIAGELGYPVLIKGALGGGGKGMRIVHDEKALDIAIKMAQEELKTAVKDSSVYIEKFIEDPKHIEFQILADVHGNVVHVGERECTIQRRHQKLIEESPSLALNDELRKKMGDAAKEVARRIGYSNLGTVEFILDKNGNFYFIEMNTRLQVEHPVTEAVTGIDLVKEQIRLAAGEELGYSQTDLCLRGHAIECRINAEDPTNNFTPSTGVISRLTMPGGPWVRFDTHIVQGIEITSSYDSMIGKLITWGRNREESINRMLRALNEFEIEGIATTIPMHINILKDSHFVEGHFYTNFIDIKSETLFKKNKS